MSTVQVSRWSGEFGRAYTERNLLSPAQVDELYARNYGHTRSDLNQRFLMSLPHSARILEIGCNAGNQLALLRDMGFHNLCGIEVQDYALEFARSRLPGLDLRQGTAFDTGFSSGGFDLVFTSGVLIHISPDDLPRAMKEIYRCSSEYIWGFEYFSPSTQEVSYRGNNDLLWKADYPNLYLQMFDDLEIIKTEYLQYLDNPNVDCMFLLKKSGKTRSD